MISIVDESREHRLTRFQLIDYLNQGGVYLVTDSYTRRMLTRCASTDGVIKVSNFTHVTYIEMLGFLGLAQGEDKFRLSV